MALPYSLKEEDHFGTTGQQRRIIDKYSMLRVISLRTHDRKESTSVGLPLGEYAAVPLLAIVRLLGIRERRRGS